MIAYFIVGIVFWTALLKSGVHATLAGFVFAFFIPYSEEKKENLLLKLEHSLHPWIAFMIIPVFAFANSGINFSELSLDFFFNRLTLGIMFALVIGNSVGITSMVFLANKLLKIALPKDCSYLMIVGAAARRFSACLSFRTDFLTGDCFTTDINTTYF